MSMPVVWHLRSDHHKRFLTSTEACFTQGFPAYASLTKGVPLCSFAVKNRVFHGSERTARIGQMGNAMHVESVAIAILYACTQIQADDSILDPMLARVAKRLRLANTQAAAGA